jgi:hypothetical protein
MPKSISTNCLIALIRMDKLGDTFTNKQATECAEGLLNGMNSIVFGLLKSGTIEKLGPNKYRISEDGYRVITRVERELEK